MQLISKFRVPALLCSVAVLACELIARPFANMGISDDAPYVAMAHTLATTGHVAYNGWATAMLGWQLYLGATFIRLFGFSFTTVRMSTLFIAVLTAFLLQRTLVRAGVSERNATLGTLAIVLSPLYLMLSGTFMSDITGLFAIVLCFNGCLRALQATGTRSAVAWLCFAILTDAVCGTSRQIAWLGVLVLVPSTLWLLRSRRFVLLAGAAANIAGVLFILACLQWLKHQPYTIPEHLLPTNFPLVATLWRLTYFLLDAPFLLLPIVALFLTQLRKSRPLVLALLFLSYLLVAVHPHHVHHIFLLEPTSSQGGDWVGIHGIHEGTLLHGEPPVFLTPTMQIVLTVLSFGGLLGLIASLVRTRRSFAPPAGTSALPWKQLAWLLTPFTVVYLALLIPRATENTVFDRYWLPLLVLALFPLLRYYQDQIKPQLSFAAVVLVALTAVYGVVVTHNTFAFYRARIALAAELRSSGIPDTSVDNGFEYNFTVELQHAPAINDSRIVIPAHAYTPTAPPAGDCSSLYAGKTPHIHPVVGISFDPDACYGPAPFAPVHFSRWPGLTPGTLYVIRYTPAARP